MEYGRYQIVKELGKGTMGVVYQAHDPQIDRLVALKILRPDRVVSEAFVARFLKEARAIGRLSHPQIVTIYDVGEDHDTIYIAMEFLEGRPFNDVIKSGKLSPRQSVEIAVQVAEALDYAHGKGIVHRDIKPSNIIITDDHRVKLTDFGIARIEDTGAGHQTQAGEILGTPVYMSPEQVIGQTVDGRSDLYSLGVILYEMLVGQRPFKGNNIAAIFRSITNDKPPAPAELDPLITKNLSELVMKSLDKEADKRFQTGRQMAEALSATLRDSMVAAMGQPETSKRRLPLWGLLSLVMIIAAVAAGYWYQTTRQTTTVESATGTSSQTTEATTAETNATPQTREVANLQISTEPIGAQVYVDGLFRGKTPINLDLPLGKYEVRLNLPEHLEWEAQIELDTPGQTPLHIPLKSLK